jgi:hypothetical protein
VGLGRAAPQEAKPQVIRPPCSRPQPRIADTQVSDLQQEGGAAPRVGHHRKQEQSGTNWQWASGNHKTRTGGRCLSPRAGGSLLHMKTARGGYEAVGESWAILPRLHQKQADRGDWLDLEPPRKEASRESPPTVGGLPREGSHGAEEGGRTQALDLKQTQANKRWNHQDCDQFGRAGSEAAH